MKTWLQLLLACLIPSVLMISPARAQFVTYTFESSQFPNLAHSPFLNKTPDIGLPTFTASFASSPNPTAFTVGSVRPNLAFSGQNLMDTSAPGTFDTMSISLSMPVTDVQLDFALFSPGRLELHSSVGTATGLTGSSSQGGSLSFHSGTGLTQFDLLGFDSNNQPTLLAIDNLQLTLVPEPRTVPLILLGLGLWCVRMRGSGGHRSNRF